MTTISGFSTEMWYIPEKDATIVISVNRCDETYVNRSNYVLIPDQVKVKRYSTG
jgi:hypothetical protein